MTDTEDRVRSLTVIPPWGLPIVQGRKPVENRSRNLAGAWRGRVLILSSASRWDPLAARFIAALTDTPLPIREQCHPGHYIGAVDLVDAHRARTDCCPPWGEETGWHLVFANATQFTDPVSAIGHLGLCRITDPALIRAALNR